MFSGSDAHRLVMLPAIVTKRGGRARCFREVPFDPQACPQLPPTLLGHGNQARPVDAGFKPPAFTPGTKQRRTQRPGEVWASFGPVETLTSHAVAARAQRVRVDSLGRKPMPCVPTVKLVAFPLSAPQVAARFERPRDPNGQFTGQMVVATTGLAQFPRRRRQLRLDQIDRAITQLRQYFNCFGDRRAGQRVVTVPAFRYHAQQLASDEFAQMSAGGGRAQAGEPRDFPRPAARGRRAARSE